MTCAVEPLEAEMLQFVSALPSAADVVAAKTEAIYATLLRTSPYLKSGNFARIATEDLRRLYELYDAEFFGGRLHRLVEQQAHGRLTFRLSSRMSRAGGRTIRTVRRHCNSCGSAAATSFEIIISSALLFQTFHGEERTVEVNGVRCTDRLKALQRIFEHELVHLLEMLVWGDSSCPMPRFRALAGGLFGHSGVTHHLVTATERTVRSFDLRAGDRVSFVFEGIRHAGVVNRVNKRVTVLVESSDGAPYSDGRRYRKYYVPPSLLAKEGASDSGGSSTVTLGRPSSLVNASWITDVRSP